MSHSTSKEFDRLAEGVEGILSQFGRAYRRGEGDFLVIQDDYGIREVAVVLCRSFWITVAIPDIQSCIREAAPGWKVRVGANEGVDWNGDRDLVIDSESYWSEERHSS